MKIRVVKVFGHEVLRIESREETTVSDVVQAMVTQRLAASRDCEDDEYGDLVEGLIPCECCEEMFDPDDEVDEEVNARFADMTERLIWGKPADDDDDDE